MEIESFITTMKTIYASLIDFIESDDSESEYITLIKTFNEQKIVENTEIVRLLFQLILKISNDHNRGPDFFDKLEKIFRYLIKDKSLSISNFVPDYTSYNKRVLFFLLEKELIKPDESFLKDYLCDEYQSLFYLYPKMKKFLGEQKQKQIEKEIFDIYKEEISAYTTFNFDDKYHSSHNNKDWLDGLKIYKINNNKHIILIIKINTDFLILKQRYDLK